MRVNEVRNSQVRNSPTRRQRETTSESSGNVEKEKGLAGHGGAKLRALHQEQAVQACALGLLESSKFWSASPQGRGCSFAFALWLSFVALFQRNLEVENSLARPAYVVHPNCNVYIGTPNLAPCSRSASPVCSRCRGCFRVAGPLHPRCQRFWEHENCVLTKYRTPTPSFKESRPIRM